eukprot:2986895-Rhodomonas_salina.4
MMIPAECLPLARVLTRRGLQQAQNGAPDAVRHDRLQPDPIRDGDAGRSGPSVRPRCENLRLSARACGGVAAKTSCLVRRRWRQVVEKLSCQ